ncbi:hypothetical protein [Stenotrophomonas oahuensis]|uniref:BON domain-containing protein n=1 Tax=Stenotrophomonas oahuensis TaxID=3003271 RepID=A0ABY9YR88_9GAMM|nr:hypothetical protein [Stenotrophomonas sp. A5586]WNH53449.1 hypothetical protein PDM29_03990 [Stenotrophomonas sp. A5586]
MPTTFEGLDIQPAYQPSEDTTVGELQDREISRRFSQMLVEQLIERWQTGDCIALKVETTRRIIRVTGAVRSQALYDQIHEVINPINQAQAGAVDSSGVKIDSALAPRAR